MTILLVIVFWLMVYGLGAAAYAGYLERHDVFDDNDTEGLALASVFVWPLGLLVIVFWKLIGKHWWRLCQIIFEKVEGG